MIRLRGVEPKDLDALFSLDQECFRPGIAYSRADLSYYLRHPRSISFLAEDEDKNSVVGFIIAETYLESGRRVGHMITVDVAPARHRHGLGRMLMQAMLSRFREAGVTIVRLEVAVDNSDAQAFYERLGFSRTGRIRGFYMGTLDALAMQKALDRSGNSAQP